MDSLAAEFDGEWRVVLERVVRSQDLADLRELLDKWHRIAYQEMCEPGSYRRMLAKAERILRAGGNPDAVPFEETQALIRERLGAGG